MKEREFRNIIEKYEKLIFTICFQFVKDYQEAQNLTQETFISAYTHIDSCNIETIKPWLSRIATNKAKDYLKSAYNRRVVLGNDDSEEVSAVSILPLPETLVLAKEGVENIKEYILNMKEPYYKVSVMYFLEEKSIDEISTILKRPKKTVQTQIFRAKNILKEYIDKEG